VKVHFVVSSDWIGGFEARVVITNQTAATLKNWTLAFDMDRTVATIWNAREASKSGNRHTIDAQPYNWNRDIPAGGQVTFGFIGGPGNYKQPPTNFVFTPAGGGTPNPTPTPQPTPTPTPTPTPEPTPSQPRFSIEDASVEEPTSGSTTVLVTVKVTPTPTSILGVMYETRDGSARSGSDYVAKSGTLLFEYGVSSLTIPITVQSDAVDEGLENFTVALTAATGGEIARGLATVSIRDQGAGSPKFNYTEALQKSIYFYDAQRSGDLPDDFRVKWRGDSALTDGQDAGLDLSGGYYDAGDHVKFVLPMAGSMTLLAWGGIEYDSAYEASGQKSHLLEAVRWGMDWLMKAHPEDNVLYGQVGNGGLDHSFWGPPENMTMARPSYKADVSHPGTEIAGESAAAMAAASILFKNADPAYAQKLLGHARTLFNFAEQYQDTYTNAIPDAAGYYNSYSGYEDELMWAAAWLYRATGEISYLMKAESLYNAYFRYESFHWTQSWDGKAYGAVVLLAQITGKQVYKDTVHKWLNYWTVGDNGSRIKYTPGGLAWLDKWGSLRYSANTAFLAFIYADKVGDVGTRYRDFARSQINYMLGENPQQRSYVVGFGNNAPKNPHHRAAHGSTTNNINLPVDNKHVLFGALVGGPSAADDNAYTDDRTDYVSNEVALDYNAAFTGALARMISEFGGEPLQNFPPAENP